MVVILQQGGLGGGLNFDAKLRRESNDLEDLFLAHIGGMDSFARGLVIADRILRDPRFTLLREGRYSSFDAGPGRQFEEGKLSLAGLRDFAAAEPEPRLVSAKQELLENLFNDHLLGAD
jgi:xylose isomerase